ncbi:MAG TPA: NAD(P)/FAD-dependent oxidoreductase [Thermoanaerobacterales bacterium]|jgi:nitrite reductase (NADH) large subunit|nr:NAD(P)/FAD-dependent oxidoreductase [Thermoanaerobacterales bacterium]
MKPVIIIGGGIAALSAAEAFRKIDKDTPLIIFSGEPYYTYYRMRLSESLGKDPSIESLLVKPINWYEKNNIDVALDNQVTSIDVENNTITIDNQKKHPFSKLLLANGSSAFVPPIPGRELENVFSIRTFNDVKQFYDFTKDKKSGVVIGGGLLGLEAAWALSNNQKNITVIEGGPYILRRQLDETAANLIQSLGEKNNINFVLSGRSEELKGNKEVEQVVLGEGKTLSAEFVIFATGVRSNLDIVSNTPIKTSRGILVNDYMQTNIDNIYAAGDVAEYNGNVFGIWPVAKEQGKIAGMNLAGQATTYNEVVPSNFLKVFGIDAFSAGNTSKDGDIQKTISKYSPNDNIYQIVFIKDNSIIGTILVGNTKPALKISKAIKTKLKISDKVLNQDDFDVLVNSL